MVEMVIQLVQELRDVLKSHKLSRFNLWMEKASALKISELDAFISGLKQDIDAVNNAILTNFSNGLTEGAINKLKLIKRIMYGRCSFDLLKRKTIAFDWFL